MIFKKNKKQKQQEVFWKESEVRFRGLDETWTMMQLLKIIVEQKSVKEDRESEQKSCSMFRKRKMKWEKQMC